METLGRNIRYSMLTVAAALMFAFVSTACSNEPGPVREPVEVRGVSLNKNSLTLAVGPTETLTATITPSNATNKNVSWGSSNLSVATVSGNGLTGLVAVAPGAADGQTATITVTTGDGGKTATCVVKVDSTVGPDPGTDADLYLAGNLDSQAALWKNELEAVRLSSALSRVNSVFVSGSYVYAVGSVFDPWGQPVAALWKINDSTGSIETKYMAGSDGASAANAVFALGSDVYVVGYEYLDSSYKSVATLWKNSEPPKRLSDPNSGASGDAEALSVFVSGSDVYVVGYELVFAYGKYVATLWKNSEAPKRLGNLSSGAYGHSQANSVFVSGGDVYVAGTEYIYSPAKTAAMLWKNSDAARTLSAPNNGANGHAEAYSVCVSGSDVYVAGYETLNMKETATLWRLNGEARRLSNAPSMAYTVKAVGNDVFVLGLEEGVSRVWKNDGAYSSLQGGQAVTMFVK